jgi:hypothetical protein
VTTTRVPARRRAEAPPGLLGRLAPEAFEAWVGDRFRELGYDVRVTPFQGDHGADLLVAWAGEAAVVQCKHRPNGTVGEPVLRDLFGAMHHFGADRAVLVTTGTLTSRARAWLRGKPIEAWDAQDVRARWAAAVAETTERLAATALPVSPAGAARRTVARSGWYVYVDPDGDRWAVRLPAAIGGHPALGFEPLADSNTPVLPRSIKPRYVRLTRTSGGKTEYRKVPVGTHAAWRQMSGRTLDFRLRDGTVATYHVYGGSSGAPRSTRKARREPGALAMTRSRR